MNGRLSPAKERCLLFVYRETVERGRRVNAVDFEVSPTADTTVWALREARLLEGNTLSEDAIVYVQEVILPAVELNPHYILAPADRRALYFDDLLRKLVVDYHNFQVTMRYLDTPDAIEASKLVGDRIEALKEHIRAIMCGKIPVPELNAAADAHLKLHD